MPRACAIRTRNNHPHLELSNRRVLNSMTTAQKDYMVYFTEEDMKQVRIRKLTPKECYRLMGFSDYHEENGKLVHKDDAFESAEKVNSNAQLYKQAGNSIVVNCLYAVLKEML